MADRGQLLVHALTMASGAGRMSMWWINSDVCWRKLRLAQCSACPPSCPSCPWA